jgi:hypothetical protein
MADLERAYGAITRSAQAGFTLSIGALAAALWEGFVDHAWEPARLLSTTFAVGLVLSFLTLRGVRAASAALPVFFTVAVGVYAWYVMPSLFVANVAYVGGLALLAMYRGLQAFRVPRLLEELQATWTPRDVAAGDVFTVRDGAEFGVVKVLAVEPDRLHLRQFGLRYEERPSHVKSSTLERAPSGPGRAYAHLPLDRSEFAQWDPHFLRSEPVGAEEVRALDGWRRLHQGAAPSQSAG